MKFSVITSSYNQLDQLKKAEQHWNNQLFNDFEWIIADDGSDKDTQDWLDDRVKNRGGFSFVTQKNEGYGLTAILNKAAKIAEGDYLVFVMGDSYPKADFLENLNKVVAEDKMLNGIRMNVDQEGRIVSADWRVERVLFDLESDEVQIAQPRGWEYMTLNSMCMPRKAFEKMGGIYPGYKHYGKMDWDMAAWAHFHGLKLCWCPKAIVYHLSHPERPDHEENTKVFQQRLKEFES